MSVSQRPRQGADGSGAGHVPAADRQPAPHRQIFPGRRRGACCCRFSSARSWRIITTDRTSFYGIQVDRFLPFNFLRDVHIQTPIVWIGLVLDRRGAVPGPGDQRRRSQGARLLVDLLFWVTLFVVVGALTGNYLGIMGYISKGWFWFGNQGLSYIQLGRAWQIGFFAGLGDLERPGLSRACGRRAIRCCGNPAILVGPHQAGASVLGLDRQYRPALCVRHDPAHRDREVIHHLRFLALVGGASLGRAVLRILCRRDQRLSADGRRPGFAAAGRTLGLFGADPDLPGRRAGHRPPSLLGGRAGHVGSAGHHVLVYRSPAPGVAGHRGDPASSADQGRIGEFKYGLAYTYIIGAAFWNFVGAGVFGGGTLECAAGQLL